MKNLLKWIGALVLLLGFTAQGKAAEIFKNDDLDFNIGGRFQELGQIDINNGDRIRNKVRVYLFNVEDRLTAFGDFKGFKYHLEIAFGGEDINSSNNAQNLKEFNADIPIIPDMVYVKVGQFKVPSNLSSADYEGNLLFTQRSPLLNMFFNAGYDNGLSLWGKMGKLDGAGGVISGSPNLPQRYLPELFNFPPLTFLRIGYSDEVDADPFHPLQTGFKKPDSTKFAFHLNGMYCQDSNAGHSTDLALAGGNLNTFSANGDFGNVLMYSNWNPYLGRLNNPVNGPVSATFTNLSVDTQVRAPLGDTTMTFQAQAGWSNFKASSFAPITINGAVQTSGELNIGGGEIMASVGDNPWEIAGRFSMVIPDEGLKYSYAAGKYGRITGSDPIYEVTLPSITWHMNENAKLVADAELQFNVPVTPSDDGAYVITQMPSQVTNISATQNIFREPMITVGRMMFQYSF